MIECRNLMFTYNKKPLFSDFNFIIKDYEKVAILGESGIGKSTLLRIITGTVFPQSGIVNKDETTIGCIFQETRLLEHLTVEQNIKWVQNKNQVSDFLPSLLSMANMEYAKNLYPKQLSGGMKQRVAILRAIVNQPRLLLLDEPFQALDTQLKKKILAWMQRYFKQVSTTMIFVTHDIEEALNLSTRVVVLGGHPTNIVGDFCTKENNIRQKIEHELRR